MRSKPFWDTAGSEPHQIVVTWGETDIDYWTAVLDRGPGVVGPVESAFGIGKTTKRGTQRIWPSYCPAGDRDPRRFLQLAAGDGRRDTF